MYAYIKVRGRYLCFTFNDCVFASLSFADDMLSVLTRVHVFMRSFKPSSLVCPECKNKIKNIDGNVQKSTHGESKIILVHEMLIDLSDGSLIFFPRKKSMCGVARINHYF